MKRKTTSEREKDEATDADVLVMNEEIRSSDYRDSGSGGIMWGVLFLFSGILLLLNTFGIVHWNIWNAILRFWPVLIIIAGVQMILGGSRIARFFLRIIIFLLFGWVALIAIYETSPQVIQQLPDFFKLPIEWWEVLIK